MTDKTLTDLYNKKENYFVGNTRPEMLAFFPSNSKKVLELGCAEGSFLSNLKDHHPKIETWGVDIVESAIDQAKKKIDHALCFNPTEELSQLPNNYFDVIYFNDVLEHIVDPSKLLNEVKAKLTPNGKIIASIPNIRHFKVLMMLLFKKDFKYEQAGVMDETHLRFFTKKSMERLFAEAEYDIETITPINKSKSIRPILLKLITLGAIGQDISYLQFAVVAKPK